VITLRWIAGLVLGAAAVAGCDGTVPPVDPQVRPRTWAQPLEVKILPNLHAVSPALYRGAQPNRRGFEELHRRGIRTVINLRKLHTDDEEIGDLPFHSVHIPTWTWDLRDAQVVRFLQAATDPANHPIFVHCRHGSDRTGAMCAIYRVVVQGWERDEAIREMTSGGMGFHGFENLTEYVRTADLERLRREAGMSQ